MCKIQLIGVGVMKLSKDNKLILTITLEVVDDKCFGVDYNVDSIARKAISAARDELVRQTLVANNEEEPIGNEIVFRDLPLERFIDLDLEF